MPKRMMAPPPEPDPIGGVQINGWGLVLLALTIAVGGIVIGGLTRWIMLTR